MRPFIIAFVGRSGSSFLQGLIDDHPDAKCQGEIISQFQKDDPLSAVRKLLDQAIHSADVQVSGFKYGNANVTDGPKITDLFREYGYSAVHLTRQNRLDQYISMKLAMQNNSWRSDAGAYEAVSFVADPEHIERYIGLFEEHDKLILEEISDLPKMRLTYEQLIEPGGHNAVLDFLGLHRRSLVSRFIKQRSGTQRDAILNYDEMRERFCGTHTEEFFTD